MSDTRGVCQAPLKEGGLDTPAQPPLESPDAWWLQFAHAERISITVNEEGRITRHSKQLLKSVCLHNIKRESI